MPYYRLILVIFFNFDHKFEDIVLNCQPTVHVHSRIIIENSCTWLIIYIKIIFSHLTNMTSNQWIERPCYWSSQTIILMTMPSTWHPSFKLVDALLSLYLYTQAFVFQGGGNSEFYRVWTRFLLFIIFLEKFSSSNVKKFSGSQNNNTSLSDSLLSMLSNSALKMTSQLCRMLKNFSWTLIKW